MKSWEDKLLHSLSEYFHGGLNISFWRSCRISRVSFFHITPSSFTPSLRLKMETKHPDIQILEPDFRRAGVNRVQVVNMV